MKIVDLVKKLDKMVTKGQIMEAFEEFFSDDVITHSTAGDKSEGKAQKRDFLQSFFGNMVATDSVKLHDSFIDNDKTYSSYTFKFRNKLNERLVWNEIIRRTWQNGQVVDEYYFEGDIDQLKKEVKTQEKAIKSIEKTERKATEKATKTAVKLAKKTLKEIKKSAENVSADPEVKSPTQVVTVTKKATLSSKDKVSKKTVVDKQNLKLVEGIGPKIEQLLNADGIKTYEDLAAAKKTKLEAVLSAAGPRFSMHSPETWSKQAKLLAAGKKDELKKLQDELKGGRKV